MDGWMGGWMDGWMNGWMDGWMGGCTNGWMGGWIHNGKKNYKFLNSHSCDIGVGYIWGRVVIATGWSNWGGCSINSSITCLMTRPRLEWGLN